MITAYQFVSDDWTDLNWYKHPEPVTVSAVAPYWDEFIQDCVRSGREIPEGLTIDLYVSIWNDLCVLYRESIRS